MSQDHQAAILRRLEQDFVLSALRLAEVSLDPGRLNDIVESRIGPDKRPRFVSGSGGADSIAMECVAALRLVREAVERDGQAARLTASLLSQTLSGPSALRASDAGNSSGSESDSLRTPLILLSQWTGSESFLELHSVEQSAVILLRLLEASSLHDLVEKSAASGGLGAAHLCLAIASLPLLRDKLCPLIIPEVSLERYKRAVNDGFNLNTRPLVEMLAESVERTLANLLDSL